MSAKKKTTAATSDVRPAARAEEEFEIRSHPDGTLFRVKVADIESGKRKRIAAKRTAARRATHRGDDSGPGPALADDVSCEPEVKRPRRNTRSSAYAKETRRSVAWLKRNLPRVPEVLVILGSGLADVASLAEDATEIDYADVPGFSTPLVPGHPGRIVAGDVGGVSTLFSQGRLHYYETGSMEDTVYPIKTFLALGVSRIILTTSAGAINPDYKAGDVMVIEDHINLMGSNPFIGADPSAEPSVFVDTSKMYESTKTTQLAKMFRRVRVSWRCGVLAGMPGPQFETPAERRMLGILGADAVCMSLIPEAITAAAAAVPVTGLALMVNGATSEDGDDLSHDGTLSGARRHQARLKRLVAGLIGGR